VAYFKALSRHSLRMTKEKHETQSGSPVLWQRLELSSSET